jgi:pimeloyl-ACP methyl ester carboxylesterase
MDQMAHESIAFIEALDVGQVDLLGFSIGSFVAQQVALTRPAIVRRLVLASAAPQGAAGMHGWAAEVIGAIGAPQTSPDEYLDVFFARSEASRGAGQQALQRMYARTEDRDAATTWATREAQYDAVCTWGIPDHALLQRLSCLQLPVFVANGDSDPSQQARQRLDRHLELLRQREIAARCALQASRNLVLGQALAPRQHLAVSRLQDVARRVRHAEITQPAHGIPANTSRSSS